jgi:hypothetical protein
VLFVPFPGRLVLSFWSSNLIPAELPTPILREHTMAWAVFWAAATSVVVTFVTPQMTAADAGNLGAKAAFVFAGCNLVGWVFSYFCLPETKGRSMVEIDKMYTSKIPMRHWSKYRSTVVSETTRV